jgi:hypothetical protein
MNSIATSIVIIPGVVALLLCLLVHRTCYQQSRQAYFRAWQIAWACYSIHYALDAHSAISTRRRRLRSLPALYSLWQWRSASSSRRA